MSSTEVRESVLKGGVGSPHMSPAWVAVPGPRARRSGETLQDGSPSWRTETLSATAAEDWTPYCERGTDERELYLGAREEADSSPLGKDDPDAHTRRLHAELFLLSAEKLQESLRAFVAETSFDWEELP
jgi:hypothetical protein